MIQDKQLLAQINTFHKILMDSYTFTMMRWKAPGAGLTGQPRPRPSSKAYRSSSKLAIPCQHFPAGPRNYAGSSRKREKGDAMLARVRSRKSTPSKRALLHLAGPPGLNPARRHGSAHRSHHVPRERSWTLLNGYLN